MPCQNEQSASVNLLGRGARLNGHPNHHRSSTFGAVAMAVFEWGIMNVLDRSRTGDAPAGES